MKLSTSKLKEKISEWLNDAEVRPLLRHHSHPSECGQDLSRLLGYWDNPKGITTPEQLEQHVWDAWCDGAQWKRGEKRRLGEDADYFFERSTYDDEFKPLPEDQHYNSFIEDFLGDADQSLVDKHFMDGRCWYRTFYPDNDLADNYRLEVVTTPDDDAVIGWTVIVD